MELQDLQELVVLQEHQVPKVFKAAKVQQVPKVFKAAKVQQEPKEQQALKVYKVDKV